MEFFSESYEISRISINCLNGVCHKYTITVRGTSHDASRSYNSYSAFPLVLLPDVWSLSPQLFVYLSAVNENDGQLHETGYVKYR